MEIAGQYPGALREQAHSVPRCQSCGYVGQWQVEPLLLTHHIVIFVVLLLAFGGGLIYLLIVLLIRSSESNRAKICPSCGARNMFTFMYSDAAMSPGAYRQQAPVAELAYPGQMPSATVIASSGDPGAAPAVSLRLNGRHLATLQLTPGHRWVVGRNPDNQIRVDDPMVSGRHAVLRVRSDGSVCIADSGSTNGTFVNGAATSGEHPFRSGDVVSLGSDSASLTLDPV